MASAATAPVVEMAGSAASVGVAAPGVVGGRGERLGLGEALRFH